MTDSKLEINKFGTKRWRNKKGQLHRENGPADIHQNGTIHWRINGYPHRIDGPSDNYASGYKYWYINIGI